MRVEVARLSLSLLLCAWIGLPAFSVGLKINATLESLRIEIESDSAPPLATLANAAIDDVIAMPVPREKVVLQMRLQLLLEDTKVFSAAQRQKAAHYAVKIWRAAGFTEESGLLSASDQEILKPEGKK